MDYTCLKLNKASRYALMARNPDRSMIWKGDHVTLYMGSIKPEHDKFSGEEVILIATHYGQIFGQIHALKVQITDPYDMQKACENETPHITMCRHHAVRSVLSNEIKHWDKLCCPILLSGTLTHIIK